VVSTAFIRDFLIGEADIASFSCYSKPSASACGAFTLYWLVGPNFRSMADKRRFRLPKPRSVNSPELNIGNFSPLMQDTALLMYRSSGAHVTGAINARALYDGAEAFARIKERMKNAKHYILLESYIIKNDATGNDIKDILIERAKAGVFVCVLYDAVGCWKIGKPYLNALRENGVHAYACFLAGGFPHVSRSQLPEPPESYGDGRGIRLHGRHEHR
jgi:phosphatidylserine/phosphatidylglycerophosphate/cardiolipin synthase-like enzyme